MLDYFVDFSKDDILYDAICRILQNAGLNRKYGRDDDDWCVKIVDGRDFWATDVPKRQLVADDFVEIALADLPGFFDKTEVSLSDNAVAQVSKIRGVTIRKDCDELHLTAEEMDKLCAAWAKIKN